jgi:hypothetical protein
MAFSIGLKVFAGNVHQLLHTVIVGMIPQGALLSSTGNGFPLT